MHYQRIRPPRETREERFWKKVEKTETCWLWTGGKTKRGYGTFFIGNRRHDMAYRYAYEMLVGPIPDGLEIDHLCRNPLCVNPAHLEAVTHRENMLRGETTAAAHSRKTHCPQGHEYTPANTYVTSRGERICRACRREHDRRYRARVAAERDSR
jgi:hypothetical protein